jgi:hypothetical protein
VITTIGKTSSQNSFEGVKGASCMISRIWTRKETEDWIICTADSSTGTKVSVPIRLFGNEKPITAQLVIAYPPFKETDVSSPHIPTLFF